MALTRSRATTPTMVLPAPHAMSVTIPIRFQCPLCLDVLRRPIQLPCCQRHLCLECFKRALELTSVNCGFCRRRVVGFARTKQYKVDDTLWTAIQTTCPFLGRESNKDEREPLVDFFDEDAPPLHSDRNDAVSITGGVSITDRKTTRELHAFYDRPLHSHDVEDQRALEQTLEFLQHDLEFTAALAATSSKSSSSRSFERLLTEKSCEPERTNGSKVKTAVGTKRARTRSTVTFASDEKQSKLDHFFVASQASSRHAEDTRQNQRDTCSTCTEASSPCGTTLVHSEIKEPTRTYFLRSASHSPRPTKKRRRRPVEGCKPPLLQLKLDATNSSVALHTRSRDPTLAHAVSSKTLAPWRMLTRQRRRQSSWKCAQCTYTNTCFDKRCSMCRSLSRPETGTSSHSSQ
uniref:RING-type E3 ubiquitin transferase n=1 Tax=Hyaloperonospora arabidopsidis (strain Emoy2) TaxID=559515 RepID=M4B6A6_HYAAE